MKFFKTKTLLLSLLSLGQLKLSQAEDVKYKASSIDNGVILHAHAWSFKTIMEKLPEIQKAGYTAIQTSPITECFYNKTEAESSEFWYWPYQPISYEIGNYFLGTEDEFKQLCAKANNEYGIKIIVDAVLNHMTAHKTFIKFPFSQKSFKHYCDTALNEGCRNEITQMELLGLLDLNTQNPEVQRIAKDFLLRVLADGASGFRFDAAKHIELPDDRDVGSNYWPYVLDNGAEFQYGEALITNVSREKDYAKLMKLTDSSYGFTLREAVTQNDFSIGRIADYNITVTTDRLITWVESHDNYSNKNTESTAVTPEEIGLAWALLAARKDTTPLFFPRPRGGGGKNPQFPEGTRLGEEGDPLYKSKMVAAVNIFHNSMEGEMENLRNINDEKIVMIERGVRGAVIVNLNESEVDISSETLLLDGNYVDHVSGNTFSVVNGILTGRILPRSATVLYNSSSNGTDPYVSVVGYPVVSDNEFFEEYIDVKMEARNLSKATYSVNGQNPVDYKDGQTVRIGDKIDGGKTTLLLTGYGANGEVVNAYYTFTKNNKNDKITIYFQCEQYNGFKSCDHVNAYVYCLHSNNKAFNVKAQWPGLPMQRDKQNDMFKLDIDGYYHSPRNDMNNQCFVYFSQRTGEKSPLRGEGYTIVAKGIYGFYNYYGQYDAIYEHKPMTTSIDLPYTQVRPTPVTTTTTTTEATEAPVTTTTPAPIPEPTTTTVATTTTTAYEPVPTTTTTTTTTSIAEPAKTTSTITSTVVVTSTVQVSTTTTTTTTTTIAQQPTPNPYFTLYFEKPNDWNGNNLKAYTYQLNGRTTREHIRWPGEAMTVDTENANVYVIKINKDLGMNRIIFNDGRHQVPGSGKEGFEMKDFALYGVQGYIRQYRDNCVTTQPAPPVTTTTTTTTTKQPVPTLPPSGNQVTIYYYSGWSPAYIHYQFGSNPWTVAPGKPMTYHKDGYQKITIDIGNASAFTFVCNNGRGNWDNNNGRNYYIGQPGSYILKNGNVSAGSI